ncbi:helicase with zinc finger domain 2 [Heteronotia binoei]|uniref:helicase with zinc finger domain 2 n=1 Tax=Heteronotia binoei TaxID=13085 RepID=UPI00292D8D65|nr:helicase with zinc finger domain 2 [Heteronotia binoei]
MPRKNGVVPSLLDSLQKQLELRLACSACSLRVNESTYQLKEVEHKCMMEILLARRKGSSGKSWRKVGRRPDFPKPASYDICRYYVAGSGCKRHRNFCTFAWCKEEVAVWTFEKQTGMERHALKALVRQAQTGGLANGLSVPVRSSISEEIRSEFGGSFQEICTSCFHQSPPRISPKDSNQTCANHWKALLVHAIIDGKMKEQYTEIRPCPQHVQKLSYCIYISTGKPCKHGANRCSYAHSDVEMAVWEAEKSLGLARADLLTPSADGKPEGPPAQPEVQFYCRVCLVTCSSQESFENHCSSVEHLQMMAMDATVQWNHRAPPYGLRKFLLCGRADICEYGQDCTKAHSTEELEEWIQRTKAAEENKQLAKEGGLLSYQDRLLAEYQQSHNEVLIISEQVDGVTVTCQQPLQVWSEEKKMKYQWVFRVHSQKPLKHVALLKRAPGAAFFLAGDGLSRGLTYASGERFKPLPTSPPVSEIRVCVECCTFGIYEQWLVFDFGSRPVLAQKFQVKIGKKEAHWSVDPAAEQSSQFVDFARWHSGNRVVVPSVPRSSKEIQLLAKYKIPSLSLDFKHGAEKKPITLVNYREQMHNFLFREEEAEQTVVTKLSLQVAVSLHQMLETPCLGMRFALPGELFAHVLTPCSVTQDSKEGYLLHRSIQTAFLAPDPPTSNRVYEVSVETKAITERSVWLVIPKRCCSELGLQSGTSVKVEIQFQMNQLEFRQWHHATDQLVDVRLVLPDVAACSVPQPLEQAQLQRGNRKQSQAFSFITGQASGPRQVPPLLIYGPFGTGKTFTLAMSTLEIIKQPKTRVLICTHTNSAADIYTREYFHAYVESGHPEAIPLCIKYTHRLVKSTDPITLRYCCLSPNQDSFRLPTKEELNRHQIIITTSMLSQELGVPAGYFSHILIDEAAQMLECEALVPLSLATLHTRIVLAGDHMQMTPQLFCLQGSEQAADHTLLNRLFQYYQKEKQEAAKKSRIIFSENYRSTASIIDFISRHFYVGKGDAIHAVGQIPPHPEFHPLMFCHVAGSANQDASKTSWINVSEIMQVVEKVQEMSEKWPDEWGEHDLKKICVVSYGSQIAAIRQELRKKCLREVVVESYENLPGKEFRLIILSTVHTRESLSCISSPNLDFFNNARVLNTIMTRAQSQVIAVGDAVALCSYGQCSKVWKSFIKECIEKETVTPKTLTLEEIRQAACDRASWNRASPESEEADKEGSDTTSWFSSSESLNVDDPILQELLDERTDMVVTVNNEGLLNVKSEAPTTRSREYVSFPHEIMQNYLRMQPSLYKRCEFIKEGFDRASAFTLDNDPPLSIQIKGRVNCGMAFTGDQVLVQILPSNPEGSLHGKVVGVLKKAERERTFVCVMDEFDHHVMIPIDNTVTKIFVPGLKDSPDVLPIRKMDKAGRIRLQKCKKVSPELRKKSLFVVQVINWREGFYYPLGIVTELLPVALTLEEGLQILGIEYCLKNQFSASVNKEVAKFTLGKFASVKSGRKDCRDYLTFTVDPPGSRDLDDAISVRDLGDKYEIGVHISDVASVVSKGCALDIEAKNRGSTFYAPGTEPVCMFPPKLSQDFFSLLPEKDRHVISLFVLVSKTSDEVVEVLFNVSTIRSDRQLTYKEAEDIIHSFYKAESPSLCFSSLEHCVAVAYHFSRAHRFSRLHDDCYYHQLDEDSSLGQRCSHQMVEEFMVMFNSFVGELLTTKDPTRKLTPLRCQSEPVPQQMTQMRGKYRDIIPLSIHLSHHLGAQTSEVRLETGREFVLLTPLWDHLRSAADARDFPKMLDLITTDDVHPKLVPVNLEFRKLLSRSYFMCSNSSAQSKVGHYSLHVDTYTWASSPIRRYMDIVVQRNLLSVLLNTPVLYSSTDIELLCHDFTWKNGMAAAYEKKAHSLEMASQLKCQVQQKFAFVMNIEGMAKNVKVLFPLNKDTLPDPHLINYRALQLIEQPFYIEELNSMRLRWKRRIYSVRTKKDCTPKSLVLRDGAVTLFSIRVWRDVLEAIRNKDYGMVAHLLEEGPRKQSRSVGRMERSRCSHYVELSRELNAGDVLHLQLTTSIFRGFLVPCVQLWTVAPGFDVCLEHTEKPIDCFSKYSTQASKDNYKDASEYRRVWLPLCDMESASCAVSANDSIVLSDVCIIWEKTRTRDGKLQGTFVLTKGFLKECAIDLDFRNCYLCIRLEGLNRDQDSVESLSHSLHNLSLTKNNVETGKLVVDPATYTWVAHGRTEVFSDDEKSDRRSEKRVEFYVNFMSMENIPVEITQNSSRFTVELIPKTLPDVRKEDAIWRLKHATELAKCIALGKVPEQKPPQSKLLKRTTFDLPGNTRKLNPSQNRAIWEALSKPFTLIQGPPGTGKTVVGFHVVYWFHQLNQESRKKEIKEQTESHILYCGPSNKSVDVVAEMLMNFKALRPLRVYGEGIETMDFPYPGSSLHISRKSMRDSRSKPEIRDITLHYRIRRAPNPHALDICAFDARVKNGDMITEKETDAYKRLLRTASKYELQQHDVILCTCSASCNSILTDNLNVKQVLVDECAMSTEPETLIPVVSHPKVEKVVLLGDHKQLRPVVHNDFCKALGMETSLFERYKDQALMLDIQYRMQRDICWFPSITFYESRLKTCPGLFRHPSVFSHSDRKHCPIIFGHLEGKEKSLMVSTEDGNENSLSNLEEAEQVAKIAKQLTLDGTTKPEQIAILTPYNAQVVEVKKLLSRKGLQSVTVCTIMKSQGNEWRYVIVSTVRSCPRSAIDKRPTIAWQKKNLGFVTDPNQVNVCITRAQEGLCIIGNRYLLESNPLWRRLVQHYRDQGCLTNAAAIQIMKRKALH